MKGIVDQAGRAILEIQLRSNSSHPFRTIPVWIDTGFTGDLVLPQKTIDELGLNPSGTVDGILADGS
jgi:predicted aspartyl protease